MLNISNRISINTIGGGVFSVANSFLLDGVDEAFNGIDYAKLNPYIGGTNKQFTFLLSLKRVTVNKLSVPFGNYNGSVWTLVIQWNVDNSITLYLKASGVNKTLISTTNHNSTSIFYHFAFVVDGVTPANSKIYLNDVDITSTNTLASNTDSLANNFVIGNLGNGTTSSDGYYLLTSLISRVLTTAELTDYYNLGKPKSPQTLFGTDCKMLLTANGTGSTAQFTMTDDINTISTTSVNLEDADKTTVTPY